ncbi:MAG: haloacid dehalogenase type II [Alphaproteobacteria bacterium]|nr:haloacid dehalogenase type II [Alphaproteobacteria bacterium]
MTDIDLLKREIEVLTFDQYGTIVDMQGGLSDAAAPYLEAKGWSGDPGRLVTWWRRTHFENSMIDSLCDRGHTPYREIGHRAVDYTLTRAGIAHTSAEVRELVSAIERLRPFPEVPAALERLAKRYKHVILSNGDRDMLEAAKPYLGFEFAETISVQDAGCFKPHRRTYEMAAERLGLPCMQVMHVANHAFDCIGAKAAGMRSAFIDRRGRPFGQTQHEPDIVVTSMTELAERLA